eukprot:CAMPEP_0113892972 /NCGR_PEP_ID=MMETSP0780_2-20120614/15772_1 /TAXON_ID=652834 /ORGANISM="Palpitomonas bilix" /LENGTH=192 /DNA_ID=CAMNT_0000883087 /DNA_START=116 /DNA_END=694 /DNA_ORIENTATION=+ /assembly_acc=CAM_ASM_000599
MEKVGVVHTFDYDYMAKGKKAPDKHDKLVAAHVREIGAAVEKYPANAEAGIILAGKSMGSRIGCHVVTECKEESWMDKVKALVCFGYPLVGMNGKVRDEVLLQLDLPILFLRGTRDNMCPKDKLAATVKKMKCEYEIEVVEAGDHSLNATKKRLKEEGKTQEELHDKLNETVIAFIQKTTSGEEEKGKKAKK